MAAYMNIREEGTYYLAEYLVDRYGQQGWAEDARYYNDLDECVKQAEVYEGNGYEVRIVQLDLTRTVLEPDD